MERKRESLDQNLYTLDFPDTTVRPYIAFAISVQSGGVSEYKYSQKHKYKIINLFGILKYI